MSASRYVPIIVQQSSSNRDYRDKPGFRLRSKEFILSTSTGSVQACRRIELRRTSRRTSRRTCLRFHVSTFKTKMPHSQNREAFLF